MRRAAIVLLSSVVALLLISFLMGGLASWWVNPDYGGVRFTMDYCSTPQSP